MAVATDEWLRLIEAEYLRGFIPGGGAGVKFAVTATDAEAHVVQRAIRQIAGEQRLLAVALDSAVVRLHMIQDVFFSIARQVDWETTAQAFMEGLFAKNGYVWPRPGEAVPIAELGDANAVDITILQRDIRQWLTRQVMREPGMAQEFRIAMTRLCLHRLSPDDDSGALVPPVLEWLRGDLRAIGTLRAAQIYTKVTRHNARAMLRSLCRWLRMVGHAGLALTLDARRLPLLLPAGTEGVRYAPAALLDAYEVLRQLIDEADHFEGTTCSAIFLGDHTLV